MQHIGSNYNIIWNRNIKMEEKKEYGKIIRKERKYKRN